MPITVVLAGGLGNQLFQRAYGLALEARGYTVVFDKSQLTGGCGSASTHRDYSLDAFMVETPSGERTSLQISEKTLRFDPSLLDPPDGATVIGYFQSELYFKSIASTVRKAFTFREDLRPSRLIDIQKPDKIFLHVRRQDYLQLQHFHGMPTKAWYQNAIYEVARCMMRPLTWDDVYIFSDDREWCTYNMGGIGTVVEGRDKFVDMQLMTMCEHAILANSSYSWWGAWLRKEEGITIAPKKWFATPALDGQDEDIIPERWLRI